MLNDNYGASSRFGGCTEEYCVEIFVNMCPICDLLVLDVVPDSEHEITLLLDPVTGESVTGINTSTHLTTTRAAIHLDHESYRALTLYDRMTLVMRQVNRSAPMGKYTEHSIERVRRVIHG